MGIGSVNALQVGLGMFVRNVLVTKRIALKMAENVLNKEFDKCVNANILRMESFVRM